MIVNTSKIDLNDKLERINAEWRRSEHSLVLYRKSFVDLSPDHKQALQSKLNEEKAAFSYAHVQGILLTNAILGITKLLDNGKDAISVPSLKHGLGLRFNNTNQELLRTISTKWKELIKLEALAEITNFRRDFIAHSLLEGESFESPHIDDVDKCLGAIFSIIKDFHHLLGLGCPPRKHIRSELEKNSENFWAYFK